MAESSKRHCEICNKDVVKLKRNLQLIHPTLRDGQKNLMVVRSNKTANYIKSNSYVFCRYTYEGGKSCEKYIQKSGYVSVQHLKMYIICITMINICRLSQHLKRQHGISVRSEVGRMLMKQSRGDYPINESPKAEILPTSDSNSQDFTDENIIISTPVELNLSANTHNCTDENVLISPQVDPNLSTNTHKCTDEDVSIIPQVDPNVSANTQICTDKYIPPIDTKLLNQFLDEIWMREKKHLRRKYRRTIKRTIKGIVANTTIDKQLEEYLEF